MNFYGFYLGIRIFPTSRKMVLRYGTTGQMKMAISVLFMAISGGVGKPLMDVKLTKSKTLLSN